MARDRAGALTGQRMSERRQQGQGVSLGPRHRAGRGQAPGTRPVQGKAPGARLRAVKEPVTATQSTGAGTCPALDPPGLCLPRPRTASLLRRRDIRPAPVACLVPCSVLASPTLPLPAPAEWPWEAATCCLLSPGSPLNGTGLQVVSVLGGAWHLPLPPPEVPSLQDRRAWRVNSALCLESALQRGSLATHPKPTRSCIFLSVPPSGLSAHQGRDTSP